MDPTAQIGTVVGDAIKLVSILGEGSFAVVFLGQHIHTGETYAVKCLYKSGLNEAQLELQLREAVILSTVAGHDNIVRLLGTIHTPLYVYLVLERCQTDLFDAIMRHEGFAEPAARSLFLQLVDAVAFCHQNSIYHRDLKPENVLISHPPGKKRDTDLVIKLGDFGLSTTQSLSSEFGCGSVRYMAPECLAEGSKSQPYSPASNDVWSLAIILINLLTGKNPWIEPAAKDKHFAAHMLSPISRPDSFQVQFGFSDEFCRLLRRLFSLNPMKRPSVFDLRALVDAVPHFMKPKALKHQLPTPPIEQDTLEIIDEQTLANLSQVKASGSFSKPSVVLPSALTQSAEFGGAIWYSPYHSTPSAANAQFSSPLRDTIPQSATRGGFPSIATPYYDAVDSASPSQSQSMQFNSSVASPGTQNGAGVRKKAHRKRTNNLGGPKASNILLSPYLSPVPHVKSSPLAAHMPYSSDLHCEITPSDDSALFYETDTMFAAFRKQHDIVSTTSSCCSSPVFSPMSSRCATPVQLKAADARKHLPYSTNRRRQQSGMVKSKQLNTPSRISSKNVMLKSSSVICEPLSPVSPEKSAPVLLDAAPETSLYSSSKVTTCSPPQEGIVVHKSDILSNAIQGLRSILFEVSDREPVV